MPAWMADSSGPAGTTTSRYSVVVSGLPHASGGSSDSNAVRVIKRMSRDKECQYRPHYAPNG